MPQTSKAKLTNAKREFKITSLHSVLLLEQGINDKGAFSDLVINTENKKILHLNSIINSINGDISQEITYDNFHLHYTFNVKKNKNIHNVTGILNKKKITGTFNSSTKELKLSENNIKVSIDLPSKIEKIINCLPLEYRFDTNSNMNPNTIHTDMVSLGRAACWAFAGLGAAAACTGTFGIGCIAGALGFGAAASICNDQY